MNKYQKMLQQLANIISKHATFELKVNRRNGYYAIDEYRDSKYMGYLTCGNYKECYQYLAGMRDMILIVRAGSLPF